MTSSTPITERQPHWLAYIRAADAFEYAAGMNLYGYVSNDPMNLVDPLGLD